MKKLIASLVIAATILPMSYANARGGHSYHGSDYGRALGYTAAAVVTAGAISYLCCSNNNNSYQQGRYDQRRYEDSMREQAAYDYEMRNRYYQPPVYVAPAPVYYAPPQPVYYAPSYYAPPPRQVIYYRSYP